VTHVDHFLAEPLGDLPERRPGSLRRTSHVDMIPLGDGELELRGAAVDPTGVATCRAVLAADRTLISLELAPEVAGSDGLVGRVVGRGFRAAVDERYPPGTLPSVLLSELPVAALLSGYGSLYAGLLPLSGSDGVGLPEDICAGWVTSGTMMVHVREKGDVPVPRGPVAPSNGSGGSDGTGGASGWHDMPDLSPGSMRRQRLIERKGPDVWAMFRDSYTRLDGVTTVLHEYTVEATVTGGVSAGGDGDLRIATCEATPRVLPWVECPQAARSAQRLVGQRLGDLRQLVRDELRGTSTCTHLNDLLSSLSQAESLVG
jgi:Protein of unknown function (DUF2889)